MLEVHTLDLGALARQQGLKAGELAKGHTGGYEERVVIARDGWGALFGSRDARVLWADLEVRSEVGPCSVTLEYDGHVVDRAHVDGNGWTPLRETAQNPIDYAGRLAEPGFPHMPRPRSGDAKEPCGTSGERSGAGLRCSAPRAVLRVRMCSFRASTNLLAKATHYRCFLPLQRAELHIVAPRAP